MSNALVDRLIQKFGEDFRQQAKDATLTKGFLRTCDADQFEWFLQTRTVEVNSLLEGEQIVADAKKNRASQGISELYSMATSGEITKAELEQIIYERYGTEIDQFTKEYPQGLWATEAGNATALWQYLGLNNLPPEYENLVRAFGELVSPARGPASTMVIQVGDQKLTGLALRDAVAANPFEILNPAGTAPSQPEKYVSADEYLADPANGLKDTRRPDLIEKRFWTEWRRFLNSPVGKAYANWNSPQVAGLVLDYMKTHDLNPNEQTFRQAASAVAESISINLDSEVGINHGSVVTVSNQGGREVPVGQLAPVLTNNPAKQWTHAEVNRLIRELSADDYLALLNSDPTFKHAVNRFGL